VAEFADLAHRHHTAEKGVGDGCCWHRKAWNVLYGRRSVLMNPAREWFHNLDVWKWHRREIL